MSELCAIVNILRASGLWDGRLSRFIPVSVVSSTGLEQEYVTLLNGITDPSLQQELLIGIMESLNTEQTVIDRLTVTLGIRACDRCVQGLLVCGTVYDCTTSLLRDSPDPNVTGSIAYEPFLQTTATFLGNGILYIGNTVATILQYNPLVATPGMYSDTNVATNVATNVVTSLVVNLHGNTHLCMITHTCV